VRRCVEAEPRHGEVWCRVRKSVKNWHDTVDVLLKKTIKEIGVDPKP
jgi:pre-mRNA-processing factor 6